MLFAFCRLQLLGVGSPNPDEPLPLSLPALLETRRIRRHGNDSAASFLCPLISDASLVLAVVMLFIEDEQSATAPEPPDLGSGQSPGGEGGGPP